MTRDCHIVDNVEPTLEDLKRLPSLLTNTQKVYYSPVNDVLLYFGDARGDGRTLTFIVKIYQNIDKKFGKKLKEKTLSSTTATADYVNKQGRMDAQQASLILRQ